MGGGNGGATFADALGAALDRRGISLTRLRDMLAARGYRISLAALSYWRAGAREPARIQSLEMMAQIEEILDLNPGALSELLGGRRAADGRPRAGAPAAFDELAGVLESAEPGVLIGEDVVDRLSFVLVVDIDEDRRVTRMRLTQVYAGAVDGAEAVTMFVGPTMGTDTEPLQLRAVAGCTIGPVRHHRGDVRTVLLEFDRPLMRGESIVTEIEIVPTRGFDDMDTEYGLVAEQNLEDCMVWVRFHPDRLPARTWIGFTEGGLDQEWEVDLAGATGLHHRQASFGPGICYARWEW